LGKFFKNFGIWIILIIVLFGVYTLMSFSGLNQAIDFSELVNEINEGNVLTLNYKENVVTIETNDKDKYNENIIKTCYVPSLDMLYVHAGDALKTQVESGKIKIETPEPDNYPWFLSMLPTILLLVIMVGF